ncbi:CRN1 Coronin-like protein [Candida maltosa Xu316]
MRASKYRHVFGQPAKKELCYENLKITKNAWDSNIIQTNGKYIAVNWDASGGGAFAIIPIEEVGKAPDTVPLFRGHKGPVLDTAFNPFNEKQIASCSDDGSILIWEIPDDYSFHRYVDEEENIKDITEPAKVLAGHSRKVGLIEFHPCAENVLASSSLDYTVKIWNTETGKAEITLPHKDLVTSFAFNYNGDLLATCSRDKKLRIWDIRTGKIVSEGPGHTGAKPSRVTWLGNTDRIVTTGFSRLSDRQVGIWDIHNIDKGPINGFMVIDSGSGVLIPHFDNETSILYIAGKGDGNIRYYEYDNDDLFELSQYGSIDPQRGFAVAPKHSVNVKENEVTKSFKTVFDHSIEPISFIVPRRAESFQSDIYPDCPSKQPALKAEQWFAGDEVNGPLLMTMEALYEGTEPEIRESEPATVVDKAKKVAEQKKKEEQEIAQQAKAVEEKREVPTKKEEVAREGTPGKNVDDVLKNSDQVNSLLSKVADQSDDEDNHEEEEEKDDSWEEVKKSDVKSMSSAESETKEEEKTKEVVKEEPKVKEPVKEEPKEEPVKETPKVKEIIKEEPKPEPKKEEPKPEPKKEEPKPEPKKEEPKPEPKEDSKVVKPTLGSTIEKLANLVVKLEAQVTKLTESGLEKDERLAALEKKIEELLTK